jgi:hypothetical protein
MLIGIILSLLLGEVVDALHNDTAVQKNSSLAYKPLFERHSNHTPVFVNLTRDSANPVITDLLIGNDTAVIGREKRDATELPVGTWCVNFLCSLQYRRSANCFTRWMITLLVLPARPAPTALAAVVLVFAAMPRAVAVLMFVSLTAMPKHHVVSTQTLPVPPVL